MVIYRRVIVVATLWLLATGASVYASKTIHRHQVAEGETLDAIAQRYHVAIAVIVEQNPWLQENAGLRALRPGEVLTISVEASSPQAPAADDQKTQENPSAAPPPPLVSRRAASPRQRGMDQQVEGVVGVLARATGIYQQPSRGASRLYRCEAGQRVVVIQHQPPWLGLLMLDGSVGWAPADAIRLTDQRVVGRLRPLAKGGAQIVAAALRYLGVPYRYGGTGTAGIDCSGFVQRVFRECGRRLPRTAAEQFNVGLPLSVTELQPGDRLYFASGGARVNHTGIYIGSGQFVHATSRVGCVTVSYLSEPSYAGTYVGARR